MKRVVAGVGINDADYPVKVCQELPKVGGKRKREVVFSCPYYKVWENMLNRCYSDSYKKRRPTYEGCTVCKDWLLFSNFRNWMEQQTWKGRQLDKDLRYKGNKVYCPDTCVFLPAKINSFLLNKNSNSLLEGVSWVKSSKCYKTTCSNPITKKVVSIGYYSTETAAHVVWKNYKLSLIPFICEGYDDACTLQKYLEDYYKLSEEEKILLKESEKCRIYGKTSRTEKYRVYKPIN